MALYKIFIITFIYNLIIIINSKSCAKKDILYTYTECDSSGNRYRVGIPQSCTVDSSSGLKLDPIKAKNCGFKCDPGQFLDITSQECTPCPAGTYSMGDGVRHENWDSLPHGFITSGFDDGESLNCSQSGWVPQGPYISSHDGPCVSVLIYSVDLAQDGEVSFEYQFSDSNTMFQFEVQNDLCQLSHESEKNSFVPATDAGRWKKQKANLKVGQNLLQWISFTTDYEGGIGDRNPHKHSHTPVMIRAIEVTGIESTCAKCRPGSYSSSNSNQCTLCKINEFSLKGADKCKGCPADSYSEMGSLNCTKRLKCSKDDYFEFMEPCNSNKKTRVQYNWIKPQICNTNLPGSVTLPAPGPYLECAPCNSGSTPSKAGQNTSNSSQINSCQLCPEGQVSDGVKPCTLCPSGTQPVSDLIYSRWSSLPSNMHTKCFRLFEDNCSSDSLWRLYNDHIRAGSGFLGRTYSILKLVVDGFIDRQSSAKGGIIATVIFDFEIVCNGSCSLFFMVQGEQIHNDIVNTWKGAQKRVNITYEVSSSGKTTFSWVFSKSTSLNGRGSEHSNSQDYAAIYSITVTNVKGVGASGCQDCPLGIKGQSCIPCQPGKYYSAASKACQVCPPDNVVYRFPARSREDCRPCGPGLLPFQGRYCITDPHLVTNDGRARDFTGLLGFHNVSGTHLFTGKGMRYFHFFNFTLDNTNPDNLVTCSNNMTGPGGASQVRSLICRKTIVPSSSLSSKNALSTQPISLGDELVSVKNSNYSKTFWDEMNRLLNASGWSRDEFGHDLHFKFITSRPTYACTDNRTTIITVRCDPAASGTVDDVQLPPLCPDGTCNGCDHHILWTSRYACPICNNSDFEVVRGECIGGSQTLHYYAPKYCVFGKDDKNIKMTQSVSCPILSRTAKISVACVALFGVILVALLFHCHKSNKKLQYKYSKLIETSASADRDGAELPGAESCAVHEDEDEEDDIQVRSSGSSRAFFSRIKNIRRPGGSYSHDNMESVNLTEKAEYGI